MIRRTLSLVLAWGALALPMSVYGHNGEVLVARLTLRGDGSCALRVTADLDANYRIRDRERMMEAMDGLLLVSYGTAAEPFARSAGTPKFSVTTRLETDSPFQHTPEELARTYRLDNAEWEWTPHKPGFVLSLPEGSPHTVLLWMLDETKAGEKSRWTMMVAGDESPLITAPVPLRVRTDGRGLRWPYMAAAMIGMTAAWLVARRLARWATP
ncbi:MAG: hypothetical protein ACKORB_07165 [Opitutia bacterium]